MHDFFLNELETVCDLLMRRLYLLVLIIGKAAVTNLKAVLRASDLSDRTGRWYSVPPNIIQRPLGADIFTDSPVEAHFHRR
jgi:hypothetical protein